MIAICIHDNVGGAVPLHGEVKRDGDKIVITTKEFVFEIDVDRIMAALGDEGHG